MARDKKPKKANKSKYADPKTGQFRHSDGDRRHRGNIGVNKAFKKLLREFGSVPPPDQPPAE